METTKSEKQQKRNSARYRIPRQVIRNVFGDCRIRDLVPNPKNGKSRDRFEVLREGMTISQALDNGYTESDFLYDTAREFYRLE